MSKVVSRPETEADEGGQEAVEPNLTIMVWFYIRRPFTQ
jgi:hypothetical protein